MAERQAAPLTWGGTGETQLGPDTSTATGQERKESHRVPGPPQTRMKGERFFGRGAHD